ncbi:MAG: sugar phosphate isomerase/epimerase [Lentisphaerae bacterium]|nr:sugar phosphate isomerase/epimerase [Lentisphaerota bacterium]
MKLQNFELKNQKIRSAFDDIKKSHPEKLSKRLKLSWSNWGFGMESLAISAKRLAGAGIKYIELHGNHYGNDLGYKTSETLQVLKDNGIEVAGICGMFSPNNDLSSNSPQQRQNAIDYLKRTLSFADEVGGSYVLVVPGAVGRPNAYDDLEFDRSVETLRIVADIFVEHDIKAAIEPIRSAEVSFCHTIADAKKYIAAVNHPGVKHINGDLYHMQVEESHIGEALIDAGGMLTNLHMADSNRCALGDGAMDLDTIIMALYVIGYNNCSGCYVTPEPLGPGGDPYPAMYGKPDAKQLDRMVNQTATYFREREDAVLQG